MSIKLILSKVTFLSITFRITIQILKQIEKYIFKHIWQFSNREPIARKTLFLPKTQGGIRLTEAKYQSLAMRLKHFLILKDEQNQERWIPFARYMLATTLYTPHEDFLYMICNNILKADQSQINFYFEDIIT